MEKRCRISMIINFIFSRNLQLKSQKPPLILTLGTNKWVEDYIVFERKWNRLFQQRISFTYFISRPGFLFGDFLFFESEAIFLSLKNFLKLRDSI